jgi:outer membrane protein assembly factor BamB
MRSLTLPKGWIAAFAAFMLVVLVAVVVVVRSRQAGCTDELVDGPRNPLLSRSGMADQPDDRLDRLASAVGALDAPFGEVLAGVGYDYDQWLHLYGIEGGVLAWTKNNAPVTLLDPDSLEPRWALRPATKRTAWDASGDRFLLLDLSSKQGTRVSSYDVADGHRVWCARLGQEHESGDPVATTFLDGGDVITALPDGRAIALARLDGRTGDQRWDRSYTTLAHADFLGPLTDDLVLAGGTEEFRLADANPASRGGPAITALSISDGNPAWSWSADPGSLVHVVGIDSGRVIAVERSADGIRLVALSDSGEEVWSTTPADAAYEATLRDGVVLMKSRSTLSGYDAETGKQVWQDTIPTDRTYFPYGFTLGQMPSLDDGHVLVPSTTELLVLDVHDGTQHGYPLPVDGINTTYWPYQLLSTPDLLGVVTNTGAVVARRDVGGVG